jgi:NAD(P)-dependent dehydrogenase (short-subunit alcohol dehydrogenase family)
MDPSSALLTNKVAIITGGGQGIGKGVALTFARFGANVVIADRNAKLGESAAADIRALGRKGLAITTDVKDFEQVKAMVDRTVRELGGVDVLVNNAGGQIPHPFLEMGPDRWRRAVDLNLMGMVHCTDAVVRAMIAGKRCGSIINISSIEGSRAVPGYSIYGACKAGMDNFAKTGALEFGDYGIRINSIAPDVIDTGLVTDLRKSENEAVVRSGIPLARLGTVEEVGGAAVFLASDLSSYVTGITLFVDGGTWAAGGWKHEGDSWTLFPGIRMGPRKPVPKE